MEALSSNDKIKGMAAQVEALLRSQREPMMSPVEDAIERHSADTADQIAEAAAPDSATWAATVIDEMDSTMPARSLASD